MADSRAKRMQVVLVLAERNEQQAGREFGQYQQQVETETEQLRQLDAYANQYLQAYSERKIGIKPQELIAYSSFIQRLGEVRKDQQQRLERMSQNLNRLQQAWQLAYRKRESIKELIVRLTTEENLQIDKRLQKELDELVNQSYSRNSEASEMKF